MGQLTEALRDTAGRRAIEEQGGTFNYDDPVEMVMDLGALARAFPEATILSNDDPLSRHIGFITYWIRDEDEVVVRVSAPLDNLYREDDLDEAGFPGEPSRLRQAAIQAAMVRREVRGCLRTAEGRFRLLRSICQQIRQQAAWGEHIDDVPRPSSWELMMDDDFLPL